MTKQRQRKDLNLSKDTWQCKKNKACGEKQVWEVHNNIAETLQLNTEYLDTVRKHCNDKAEVETCKKALINLIVIV